MEELIIASFKYGLDTRKDVLTSQVGTLVACENCHINPGGEVDKRKAFDQYLNVAILDTNGSQGTFGLETVDVGLMVFGSALVFGTTPSQSQPVLASAMPAGVTYQQLKHPSLTNDSSENYDATYHRMTVVRFSENFNGKSFVSAKFSDGRTFLYYNGALIQQSANGVVMEGRTALADLANDLTRQFGDIDWLAVANFDENSVAQNGAVVVKSPALNHFTPVPSDTSTLGLIGFKFVTPLDVSATGGTSPSASFVVAINAGTFTVSAPTDVTGATYANITDTAIAAAGSAALTAAAIVQAINDLTYLYGYTALASGASVKVFAPATYGAAFVSELRVAYTGADGSAAASVPTPVALGLTITPNPAIKTQSRSGQGVSAQIQVAATPSGGTAPYFYEWKVTPSGLGASRDIMISGFINSVSCVFSFTIPFGTVIPIGSTYVVNNAGTCKVTDNVGATLTVPLNITFNFTP